MCKSCTEKNLLVIARQKKHGKRGIWLTPEHQDLAIAWLTGEISYKQIETVLGISGSNIYNFLAMSIRAAYKDGRLTRKGGDSD